MTVRISVILCGLALLLAVAIGSGAGGYWLAGDSVEAQGTWQLHSIHVQGESTAALVPKFLNTLSADCAVDMQILPDESGPFYEFAYACP